MTITIDPSPELSLEVTDRSCHSALGCTESTHPSLAFSLAPVMQNPSQGQALHAFAHTSLPCTPVTRTGPRTRRGVEAGKGEEEGRVPAGPVLGAGARERSHSWPCSEEPPFWQENTVTGLGSVVKIGWVFKPHSPGGCRREGQAAGSPPRIARAAQSCCESLGDRETVSTPLTSPP